MIRLFMKQALFVFSFYGLLSMASVDPLFSATEVTKADGTPADYVPLTPQMANSLLSNVQSLASQGKLNQTSILVNNAHGALVRNSVSPVGVVKSDAPILRSAESKSSSPNAITKEATKTHLAQNQTSSNTINGVRYWGQQDGYQYLEVYGNFTSKTFSLNCDSSLVPNNNGISSNFGVGVTYFSSNQVNLRIPNNLLDRQCTVANVDPRSSGALGFATFTLPGLSCDTWNQLCPASVRGTFQTKTSDGRPISIEIRDGQDEGARLSDADVSAIMDYLGQLPPDVLKGITFVQGTSNPNAAYQGLAGNGGIYFQHPTKATYAVGTSPAESSYGVMSVAQSVAFGLGQHLFWQLSDGDRKIVDQSAGIARSEEAFSSMFATLATDTRGTQTSAMGGLAKAIDTHYANQDISAYNLVRFLVASTFLYSQGALPSIKPSETTPGGVAADTPIPVTYSGHSLTIDGYSLTLTQTSSEWQISAMTTPDGHSYSFSPPSLYLPTQGLSLPSSVIKAFGIS